jgi:hypothetical protein
MKLEHLRQAETILSKCGRPQLPGGISVLPLYRGFVMPMVLDPGTSYTFTKEITGDAPWVLSAISSDQASGSLVGIRCQIQLPNGKFLFGGNGVDIGQFSWIGSWRWLQDPELRCETGSKIQVTLTDTTASGLAAATPVNLFFEGAFLYFMQGGVEVVAPSKLASTLPRYFGIVNENILAPAWMSNEGLETPPGYEDEYFVYSTPDPLDSSQGTTWTLAAGLTTVFPSPLPFEIVIDAGYEFVCRRILLDIQVTSTALAIVLARLRTGAGYVLMDNQIDVARYLNGAEFAGRWVIGSSDSVFIDPQLGDATGTGNVTLQVHLEGYRRRKV